MLLAGPVRVVCLSACLIISPMTLPGQETPPPEGLRIVIIQGDNFTNNVKKGTASEPIVEVRDRNNSPVPGAIVVFTLPQNGASGAFVNGGKMIQVVTDEAGRAHAVFHPVGQGALKINVSASFQGQNATTSLTQTNVAAAAAGAGAAGGLAGAIAAHGVLVGVVSAVAVTTAVVAAKVVTGGGGKNAKVSVGSISVP